MRRLWYGGNIYTMQEPFQKIEAVLVDNDKIYRLGTYKELAPLADEKIDLNGATMFPGFVDSHLHMIGYGESLLRVDLTKATSSEEIIQLLKNAAQDLREEEWLVAEGWDDHKLKNRKIPTLSQLDSIRKGPILLKRVCRHVGLTNSEGLSLLGITQLTKNPEGGQIGRDTKGNLNGLLYDNAYNNAIRRIPPLDDFKIIKALEKAIHKMQSFGLTGGHTEDMSYYGHFSRPLNAFKQTIGKKHHFRVNLLLHHTVFKEMMNADLTYDLPFVEPGAMKIFADGSMGGSTAALSQPYQGEGENRGLLIHTDRELDNWISLARKYNTPVAIHTIGDASCEQVIRALEKSPAPEGKKDRLIHCCLVRGDLIERMKNLSIIVDIQPSFVPSDFPWIVDKLGEERIVYTCAWKTLINAGLICAGGTDAPIEQVNPIESIYAAVARKKRYDQHNGYLPHEKLTHFEAIRLYTIGSAKAISKEHCRGYIAEGYDADFSIFDKDLLTIETEQILSTKAIQTVVAGQIVYQAK